MRDPEILERLDPQDLFGLCKRLQNYMALCADHAAKNQNDITNRIRDVSYIQIEKKNKYSRFLYLESISITNLKQI